MAGLLELAQLLEHDGVAEVDVGGGRVDAELDPQGAIAGELLLELPRRQHVDRVTRQVRHRPNARLPPSLSGPWGSRSSSKSLMAALGTKPRRRGGAHPPPPPPAPQEKRKKPRLKKLRILFVLLGLAHPGDGLDRLRDDGGGLPRPAGDLQLRPVQGLEEQRGLRRRRRTDRHPDQQPEQDPAQLGSDLPEHQERGGLDRGHALLRAQRGRLPGRSAAPWSKTSSARAPPRAARRSPSSSSRTRSTPRTAARSSRSSARRRSPTGSSATGARTRSSPST